MRAQSAVLSHLEHDGCTFAYRVGGSGPPVVFIQGVGLHGDGWRPQVDGLAEHLTCLTFDNRGMAGSQPVPDRLTVSQMAQDTLALMDGQGWRSAHLVGHSLGALVAIEAAALDPDRVRSLALLCAVVRGRDATRITWPIVRVGVAARLGSRAQAREAFLRLTLSRSALRAADRAQLAADLAPLFGHDLAEQPPVVDAQVRALRAYDATSRLTRLHGIPALVVAASEDPIAPTRFGRRLAAGLPGSTFVEVPKAAHGVTMTHAAPINRLLRSHVERAAGMWATAGA